LRTLAQIEVERCQAILDYLRRKTERLRRCQGGTSIQELDDAEHAIRLAELDLESAHLKLEQP
jgi:hypothetical protein